MIYNNPGNDIDLLESFLNRRRNAEYTDKLLDQLLHDSTSSKRLSFPSGISSSNVSMMRSDETEIHQHSERESDTSELDQKLSTHAKKVENPLENLYMITVLQNWFNIRPGSFSEMVVNVRSI